MIPLVGWVLIDFCLCDMWVWHGEMFSESLKEPPYGTAFLWVLWDFRGNISAWGYQDDSRFWKFCNFDKEYTPLKTSRVPWKIVVGRRGVNLNLDLSPFLKPHLWNKNWGLLKLRILPWYWSDSQWLWEFVADSEKTWKILGSNTLGKHKLILLLVKLQSGRSFARKSLDSACVRFCVVLASQVLFEKVGNISLCPEEQPLTGLVALWDWHIHYGLARIPYSPHSFYHSSNIIQIGKPSISLEYILGYTVFFESLHFLKVQHGTWQMLISKSTNVLGYLFWRELARISC